MADQQMNRWQQLQGTADAALSGGQAQPAEAPISMEPQAPIEMPQPSVGGYNHGGYISMHHMLHRADGGVVDKALQAVPDDMPVEQAMSPEPPVDIAQQALVAPRPKFAIRRAEEIADAPIPEPEHKIHEIDEDEMMPVHPALNIPGVHIRTAEAGEPVFHGEK
jgi:hypothetical protein